MLSCARQRRRRRRARRRARRARGGGRRLLRVSYPAPSRSAGLLASGAYPSAPAAALARKTVSMTAASRARGQLHGLHQEAADAAPLRRALDLGLADARDRRERAPGY
jgi:hypothetical protein